MGNQNINLKKSYRKKAVIFARVSTKRQEEEGLSLTEIQIPQMKEYADRNNMEVVKIFYFNESAGAGIRKKFNEFLNYIHKNKGVEAILAYRVDRLTRNFLDAVKIDELREKHGKELHFVSDRIVLKERATGSDLTTWDTHVFLAKQLMNRMKDNGYDTFRTKFENNELPWKAPFGYKNVRLGRRKTTVEIVPFEAEVVRRAFELYATGTFSYKSLTERLYKDYQVKLNWSTLSSFLKNRFYIGEIYSKKYNESCQHSYGNIVSNELFSQVQEVIASRGKKRSKCKGKPFTYRGLIRCKVCGCAITPEGKERHQKNGNYHKYVYYHCSQRKLKHDMARLPEGKIDLMFSNWFRKMKIPKEELIALQKTLKESHNNKIQTNKTEIGHHNREIAKIQSRIETAYEDRCDGNIGKEEFDNLRNKWRKEQDYHRNKLERIHKIDEEYYITVSYLMEIAANGEELFKRATMEEKRELIGLTCQDIFLDGENLEITAVEPFRSFIKCNNNKLWYLKEGKKYLVADYGIFRMYGAIDDYEWGESEW